MPLLETPGMTTASLPYTSTAVAVFACTQEARPIPFPNSPSNTRSRCHDGAIHSLSVRPERLPVPPDWVLRLRVGSAATQVTPPCLTPGYRARRDLPGRGPSTPLVSAGLGPRCGRDSVAPDAACRTPR